MRIDVPPPQVFEHLSHSDHSSGNLVTKRGVSVERRVVVVVFDVEVVNVVDVDVDDVDVV